MQEGQRLFIVERAHLWHEPGEEIERAVGLGDEARERGAPVAALLGVGPVDKRPAGGFRTVRGRQPAQRQVVAALEMLAFAEKLGLPLAVNQPGRGVGEVAVRVSRCLAPLGIEEQCPAGAEPLEHVVRPRTGRHQLGFRGGFEVGAAEAQRALKAAVLVEYDARRDERRPGQMVGQPVGAMAVFGEVQHAK